MSTINHRTLPTILTELRSATVPTGVIEMYGGTTAPGGWLLCDGSAVDRIAYASLFAVLGTTYGVGDGSTTFNLPDFTNKFARGNTPGTGGGSDTHTHPLSANGAALYQLGGTNMFYSQATVPSWNPGFQWTATGYSRTSGGGAQTTGTALTGATDSASNVPAYTGVQFIIKT
jgi:microcystin-dependent protein